MKTLFEQYKEDYYTFTCHGGCSLPDDMCDECNEGVIIEMNNKTIKQSYLNAIDCMVERHELQKSRTDHVINYGMLLEDEIKHLQEQRKKIEEYV